jgi:hypothetical protein
MGAVIGGFGIVFFLAILNYLTDGWFPFLAGVALILSVIFAKDNNR